MLKWFSCVDLFKDSGVNVINKFERGYTEIMQSDW